MDAERVKEESRGTGVADGGKPPRGLPEAGREVPAGAQGPLESVRPRSSGAGTWREAGRGPPRGDAIDLSTGGLRKRRLVPPEGTPGPPASAQAPQREGLGPAAQSCPGLLGLAFQKQSCPAASDTS